MDFHKYNGSSSPVRSNSAGLFKSTYSVRLKASNLQITCRTSCQLDLHVELFETLSSQFRRKFCERILNYAKLFSWQHNYGKIGFRNGSSATLCVLTALHDHVTRTMDNPKVEGVQIITNDFSKGFDRLRHDVIMKRMVDCNMPCELIWWISGYLAN